MAIYFEHNLGLDICQVRELFQLTTELILAPVRSILSALENETILALI